MPLQTVNPSSAFVKRLLSTEALSTDPIYVMDIGASGGVEDYLLTLQPHLTVDAFDPLVTEMERLQRSAPPRVNYWSMFVDSGEDSHHQTEARALESFHLSSAQRFVDLKHIDYRQEYFNGGKAPLLSNLRTTVDTFLTDMRRPTPSFMKIDTDGHDIEVLWGASSTLSNPLLAAVQIECQFHGGTGSTANTFANIDILMRKAGFRLFILEPWMYSRAEMPAPFVYDIPAQTKWGCVEWADALYLRDPVVDTSQWEFYKENPLALLKLVLIAALHGCNDFVASLVSHGSQRYPDSVLGQSDLLDDLVPPNPWGLSSYSDYMEKFTEDPTAFLPSQWLRKESPRTSRYRLLRKLMHAMG